MRVGRAARDNTTKKTAFSIAGVAAAALFTIGMAGPAMASSTDSSPVVLAPQVGVGDVASGGVLATERPWRTASDRARLPAHARGDRRHARMAL
jgi:hypothetical protein